MSKQSSGLTGSKSNQIGIWHLVGGRVISIIITLFLVMLIWFLLQQLNQVGAINLLHVILLGILTAALSMAFERSLVFLPLSRPKASTLKLEDRF